MAIILLPHIPFFDKILQSPKETKTLWAKNTKNQIKAFFILTMIVFCRSGIFFGLNTFIPLFWIHHYHASQTEGSIALTIFFLMGTIGTILGGNLADRFRIRQYRKIWLYFTFTSPSCFSFYKQSGFGNDISIAYRLCSIYGV